MSFNTGLISDNSDKFLSSFGILIASGRVFLLVDRQWRSSKWPLVDGLGLRLDMEEEREGVGHE